MEIQTRRRPGWLSLGLSLVTLAILTACGGDDEPAPTTGAQLAPPDQQVLNLRLTAEPRSIDPHLINQAGETTLTKPLFAGLFTYNEQLEVVPNVAAEIPTEGNGGISRDGMTYTINLKKDAKWSDGKAVTANDFVYSMRRALDPALAGPYASFFHVILGAREYNTALGTAAAPKTPSAAELEGMRNNIGVSAKDQHTLVYQLREPSPSFLNLLSLWTSYPVREDVIAQHGTGWTEAGNLVSNGAFMLSAWAHEQRIEMTPNPHWFGEKPKLTKLQISFIADEAAAYAAYQANELDVVNVPASVRREASQPGSLLHSQFVRMPALSTVALFMNNTQAPFDNQKVRQAFGMSIDRDAYVEGVLQGAGVTTTSWLPPGIPGYNQDLGKDYTFNPTKAKQLLAEAGYPEGRGLPPVTFIAIANDTNRLVGQFIEDQIKRNLGVEVTTEYVESRVFGARFTGKQYQATIQRWNADWPYPDSFMSNLFSTGAGNNTTGYSSAKFDELIGKAKAETDEKERLSLFDQAQKQLLEDAPIVPLYNPENFTFVKPKVRDLTITAMDGGLRGDYSFYKAYIAASD